MQDIKAEPTLRPRLCLEDDPERSVQVLMWTDVAAAALAGTLLVLLLRWWLW
jgi:hypothetical protein